MKKYFFFLIPALALIACNKEADLPSATQQPEGQAIVLKAAFDSNVASDGDVKSTVSETGIFAWSTGDAISVNSDAGFKQFDLTAGEGTNQGTFTNSAGGFTPQDVAVFPANLSPALSGTALTVTLPDTYVYAVGQAPTPMIAKVNGGTPADISLSFKHIGALVAVTFDEVPTNTSKFVFTAAGKNITGSFTLADFGTSGAEIVTADGALSTVTITGVPASETPVTFYVPIPTGTYTEFDAQLQTSGGVTVLGHRKTISQNIEAERADLLTLNASPLKINENWKITHNGSLPYPNSNSYRESLTYYDGGTSSQYYMYQISRTAWENTYYKNPYYVAGRYYINSSYSGLNAYQYTFDLTSDDYLVFMVEVAVDEETTSSKDDGKTYYKPAANYQVIEIPKRSSDTASAAYSAWLGTWTLSGQNTSDSALNQTLTIEALENNKSFHIKGWAGLPTTCALYARYDAVENTLVIEGGTERSIRHPGKYYAAQETYYYNSVRRYLKSNSNGSYYNGIYSATYENIAKIVSTGTGSASMEAVDAPSGYTTVSIMPTCVNLLTNAPTYSIVSNSALPVLSSVTLTKQ